MAGRRPADVDPARKRALDRGEVESRDLAESLAVEFGVLLGHAFPGLRRSATALLEGMQGAGITRRMALAGSILLDELGVPGIEAARLHASDTVRGWAAYAIGLRHDLDLPARFGAIRPLAADPHFGVREWAWLGVRHHVVAEPREAIAILAGWTGEADHALRRFASEATRPRGVWSPHVALLKREPEAGLPVLDALKGDPSRYVQDSVGNWLNDAGKDRPDWVRSLVNAWTAVPHGEPTARIARRAVRSLPEW